MSSNSCTASTSRFIRLIRCANNASLEAGLPCSSLPRLMKGFAGDRYDWDGKSRSTTDPTSGRTNSWTRTT
jgi:hypothetical protein